MELWSQMTFFLIAPLPPQIKTNEYILSEQLFCLLFCYPLAVFLKVDQFHFVTTFFPEQRLKRLFTIALKLP